MKLSKKNIDDLNELIYHITQDLSYGGGGTFAKNAGQDDKIDFIAVKKVSRAIELINIIIKTNSKTL